MMEIKLYVIRDTFGGVSFLSIIIEILGDKFYFIDYNRNYA